MLKNIIVAKMVEQYLAALIQNLSPANGGDVRLSIRASGAGSRDCS